MLMTNVKILAVVMGTLALYTLVAMSIPQVQSEVPEELTFSGNVSPEELMAAGEDLFGGAGACTTCHGTGTRAPNLLSDHGGEGPIGARCSDRVEGMSCKAYLYESLVDPGAHVVEGFPTMVFQASTFSSAQLWSMVAFLEAQGGEITVTGEDIESTSEPEGTATAAGGGAAGGQALGAAGGTDPVALLENNMCLNCHMLDDRGVQMGPSFNGIGARVDADYIRRSILDPNAEASEGFEQLMGVMPPTYGQTFTAAQLEAIVTYLAERR